MKWLLLFILMVLPVTSGAHIEPRDPHPLEWNGLPPLGPDADAGKMAWEGRIDPRLTWDADRTGYDALHVDLRVEPVIEEEAVIGEVKWTVVITDPPPDRLIFDFHDNMVVTETRINGSAVDFTLENDTLSLILPHTPMTGETLRAAISYHGVPEMGFIWGFDVRYHHEVPIVYTNTEPQASRTWWPCKDRPDDKFFADLAFIVPDSLIVASNGLLVETLPMEGHRMLYRWEGGYLTTTYLVSLAATNYATFEDTYHAQDDSEMPLVYYAYPEHLDRALSDWAFTPDVITFFAQLFGEYPFVDEKYGMAEYAWSGAMEHQTMTSMGAYLLNLDEPADWVVVHELAHQWWGDWVTCGTWRDIWLNEGFATYCEALWAEHVAGPDSLKQNMLAKKYDSFSGSIYDPNFIFNSTVYKKGAWVLHMLRHLVGDERFFNALRNYGERHAYGNAVTEDLRASFEETAAMSLDWFFDQWVYGTGRPTYRVLWNPVRETEAIVEVRQTTTGGDYFKMPIDACFELEGGGEFRTVLWDSLPEQFFTVELPGPAERLRIDPDAWLLADVLFVADPTAVDDVPVVTGSVSLGSPRPNPTRGETVIPLFYASDLPRERDRFSLEILDVAGRLVRRLPIAGRAALYWDGADDSGHPASPGIYYARLRGGHEECSRRIVKLQ